MCDGGTLFSHLQWSFFDDDQGSCGFHRVLTNSSPRNLVDVFIFTETFITPQEGDIFCRGYLSFIEQTPCFGWDWTNKTSSSTINKVRKTVIKKKKIPDLPGTTSICSSSDKGGGGVERVGVTGREVGGVVGGCSRGVVISVFEVGKISFLFIATSCNHTQQPS
jgi:hypothetical protein